MNHSMTASNQRIHTVDALRGFALMGIILVNILPLLDVQTPEPGTLNAYIHHLLNFTVESRFFVIFSFLFGVGFFIFISRAKEKGANATALFIRRLIALLAIGFVHKLFHPGEALFIYAIFGFILMPFYRLRARTNLWIGLILAVLTAATGFKPLLILPMFLLGLSMGQYGVFQNIPAYMPTIKKVQAVTFVLSVIGLYVQYRLLPTSTDLSYMPVVDETTPEAVVRELTYYTIAITAVGLVMAAFYTTTLIRLYQNEKVRILLAPLACYGRMALTNYIGQTVLILAAGSLLGLYGAISYVQAMLICLGIYVLQLVFSALWLRYFKMGPLEWGWRMLTYLHVPPLRKSSSKKPKLA